jgi:hypothetical protein
VKKSSLSTMWCFCRDMLFLFLLLFWLGLWLWLGLRFNWFRLWLLNGFRLFYWNRFWLLSGLRLFCFDWCDRLYNWFYNLFFIISNTMFI